jgi:hypothetical protein
MRQAVSKYLVSAALLLLAALPAHAEYIKLVGSDVDIYYQADFWGAGNATITGNSISIATDYTEYASSGDYFFTAAPGVGVFAVAHAGYALTGSTTLGVSGSYILPGTVLPFDLNGASINSSVQIYSASVTNGSFALDELAGTGSVGTSVEGTPEPSAGNFSTTFSTSEATGLYEAVGLDNIFTVVAYPKYATASLTSASFDFAVKPVSPVPDIAPSTSTLAGLLLLGTIALRQRQRRKV